MSPNKKPARASSDGGGNTSSLSQAAADFKFITGFRGNKVLVHNGHLYHINSKMKKTVYFKCSEKRKGCMAGVTMKNFNPKDCSFDSFVITNSKHVNHLPNPEKIYRRVETNQEGWDTLERPKDQDTKLKEKISARKTSQHVCLFCLVPLPSGYMEVTSLENLLPTGELLSITLDDPVKNSQAFDLLCTLLYVRWRRTQEGQKFDQRKALPLCNHCQSLYQELCQVHHQIRELEVVLSSYVKVVRDTIDKTEQTKRPKLEIESTQLVPLGLDVFRKRVVELRSVPSIHDVPMITTLGRRPGRLSQTGVKTEPSSILMSKVGFSRTSDVSSECLVVKQEVEVDQALTALQDEKDNTDNFSWQQRLGKDHPDYRTIPQKATNSSESSKRGQSSRTEDHRDYLTPPEEITRDTCSDDDTNIAGKLSSISENDSEDSDFELKMNKCLQRGERRRGRLSGKLIKRRVRPGVTTRLPYQPKKVHECHICSARVIGYTAFMSHYAEQHPEERRYSCKFCKKHFVYIGGCLAHQRRHSGERPFKCQECSKSFFDNIGLYHHRRYEHSERKSEKIACPHCPRVCTSKVSFKSHLNRHSDQVLICKAPNCSKPFRNMATFLKHNRLYHKGKAESSAPISNLTKENLESVGVTTEIKWRLRCHLCEAPIHGRCFVRKHFESCHREHLVTGNENTCRCGKQFKTYRECCIHVFRVHSGAEKSFQCEQCPQKFLTGVELQIHRSTHLPMEERHKNHICDVCGLSLASKHTMYAHMKIHSEANQSHVCEFCGKEFKLKRCLMQHKKSQHLKILPYKCHYEGCGKAFPVPSVLQKHLNAHSKEKFIKCSACDKTFNYSNSLSRHMREVHNVAGDEGQTPRKKKAKKRSFGSVHDVTKATSTQEEKETEGAIGTSSYGGEFPERFQLTTLSSQHIPVIQVNYANVSNQTAYHQRSSIYQGSSGSGLGIGVGDSFEGVQDDRGVKPEHGWQSPTSTGKSNSHSGY